MSSFQNDCNATSVDFTEQIALAIGIPGAICLALIIAGLVVELFFVCKKKNNFLLRLYIYLSVAVLLVHIDHTLYLIIFFYPQNGWLCEIVEALGFYPSMVEFMFIISVNCVLLHKVYSSVRRSCFHCHGSKATEVLFVAVHFITPLFIVGILLGTKGGPNPGECHIMSNHNNDSELWFKIATEWIPVAIELQLSIICICTLLVWCCWLLRKHFLRARMKTILKEMGLLLGFLLSYCIIRIVIEILNIQVYWNNNSVMIITYALYPINRATIPLSFIIYVCFVYLCPTRSDTNPLTDQHTSPPSTRVSLPSNTADRALNFLSKSELIDSRTETTALLVN